MFILNVQPTNSDVIVADHAPMDPPFVPDCVIDALDLPSIASLCGSMAELPRDRWTGLVVNAASPLPLVASS
jgi:hypothetical protein